jgi:beta-glucanase (GH16 family)
MREDFSGAEFTSARLVSKNKFEFEYGRVEVRAKLPTGGGTWPAIWMLGADIDSNPWPGAGEMDIMEHVGNDQDRILSTLHFPGNSGGDAIGDSAVFPGVSNEFFVYSVNWTENLIQFAVDGAIIFTYGNSGAVPFNKDFFFILNVAIGGDLGGAIDPNFDQSTMEIDYVRVYQ